MKLTIVTATFNVLRGNGAEALERCVRSVAALPVEHEHLVFDGGSTDGTVEKLKELSAALVPGPSALVLVSGPDKGIYDALNKGLSAAKGDYIYFLGADDHLISPETLAEYVERAESGGYDVFVAPTRFSNGRVFPKRAGGYSEMAMRMAYSHQGCIVRTGLLRRFGGFDVSCRCMADYKLMLSVHLSGAKVGIGTEPFAMYDVGGASSTPSAEREDEDDRIKRDVYRLSDAELADYRASSRIPFRCCRELLRSGSAFTRAMGRRLLFSYVWRKHKTDRESMRFLFGRKVFSHGLKALRGRGG